LNHLSSASDCSLSYLDMCRTITDGFIRSRGNFLTPHLLSLDKSISLLVGISFFSRLWCLLASSLIIADKSMLVTTPSNNKKRRLRRRRRRRRRRTTSGFHSQAFEMVQYWARPRQSFLQTTPPADHFSFNEEGWNSFFFFLLKEGSTLVEFFSQF